MSRVATLDLGTNTLLLLVAETTPTGELTPVRELCEFARLGQGVDHTGSLSPEAIERGLEILRRYKATCDDLRVDRLAAVGTQALREASNARTFLDQARAILGVEVEVIAGEREAELVYQAVRHSFPDLAAQQVVIADVGGGSTEIIVAAAGQLESRVSVPIGAVRLTERHLRSDPPSADQARELIAHIDTVLSELPLPKGAPLIAVSGTATTMAAVELRLRQYEPERVHGYRLAPPVVDRQLARYLELTVAERKKLPGMEPKRADVIAGGAAVFDRLVNLTQAPEMIVSDRGVRWGLAHELLPSENHAPG